MEQSSKLRELHKANAEKAEDRPESLCTPDVPRNENAGRLTEFHKLMQELLERKSYLAKSDYLPAVEKYKSVIDFFVVLEQSGMLENFCTANYISVDETRAAIDLCLNAETYIDKHNDEYVALAMEEEKEYQDISRQRFGMGEKVGDVIGYHTDHYRLVRLS